MFANWDSARAEETLLAEEAAEIERAAKKKSSRLKLAVLDLETDPFVTDAR